MERLPWGLLQPFVLVARLGNLSRVAEQSHLTVSALSHQMRQLETRLERRLFARGPHGMTLTAEGRRLLEEVGGHVDGITHALSRYRTRHRDALVLSASAGIMSSWLVPRLPRLVAAHPELELKLQSSYALVNFDREPVDVALRYGRGDWPGLHSERLFGEWVAPVAAPELLARMGDADPQDVTAWPLLGDSDPDNRWLDWFARYGGTPPKRYVALFDSSDALRHAALEGLGVALGRMVTSKSLIDAGRLRVLGNRYLSVQKAYWLVYPPRAQEHHGLQVFRDWLLAEADDYCRQLPVPGEDGAGA
jgi:DNA-binding transcriptional LysR family regulator